jgi:hypothetical protein
MPHPTRVSLEIGKTWVFASALDWPGWCRRGKGEEGAIDALLEYADRYAAIAGPGFEPGAVHVVGRTPGDATTDFGAPSSWGEWDAGALPSDEAERLGGLLTACWDRFDEIAAGAPGELRKGPRGGGRDRDPIVGHVREAERSYGRKLGVRVPPRTPWPEQREELLTALRAGAPGGAWPARYGFRRVAWHVTDHAWEIQDKST